MKIKLTEEELIIAIQERSRIGAEALYDMYSKNLYNIIFRIIQHQEIAEDTLQQVMMKIWNSFHLYHTQKGKLFTWMVTIARNLSKDALRSKSYHQYQNSSELESVITEAEARHQTTFNIDSVGIKDSLNLLSCENREILDLIYFKGYTHVEVAEELQIPLGTVKTRWSKSISTLRRLLHDSFSRPLNFSV